jgi:hypothetical protein
MGADGSVSDRPLSQGTPACLALPFGGYDPCTHPPYENRFPVGPAYDKKNSLTRDRRRTARKTRCCFPAAAHKCLHR